MIAPWSAEQEPGLAGGHRTRGLDALFIVRVAFAADDSNEVG
jgi:hypothetical protein